MSVSFKRVLLSDLTVIQNRAPLWMILARTGIDLDMPHRRYRDDNLRAEVFEQNIEYLLPGTRSVCEPVTLE